ncbi:HalOD1 output domain-containing protein [Haloarcula sp. JP-L23]|uniref:HalOD1 output domain-containing protein n=1 Tax=Haloarcula sp. JP-L23 TaxID=2716717 RepID=UPI00140F0F5F|nr:hypothetical protein G9465_10810 [Haloarcula sp. JP-L23]
MEICDTGGVDDTIEIRPEEDVSTAVARRLASTIGKNPIEMTPIAESIDPDALDKLFQNGDTDIEFRFEHEGATVRVSKAGITVQQN